MADERLTQSRAQVQADLNKIEATPEFTSVGSGLAINSKVLGVDSDVVALKSDLSTGEVDVTLNGTPTQTTETLTNVIVGNKTYNVIGQVYTAGSNIDITSNAISVNSGAATSGQFLQADGSGGAAWNTVDTRTYKAFPSSWVTNSTSKAFCASVDADGSAGKGMAYLGELRCSDLPASLVNGEAIVEIIEGTGTSNKVIHVVLTSGNRYPYRWEYTYWNNGHNTSGWIAFQPLVEFNTAYDATTNKAATMADVNGAIANVYKLQGNSSVQALNTATKTESMNGYVYNMTDAGDLNNYTGTTAVEAGDNVVFIYNGGEYVWDKLSSTIDLSGYAQSNTAISSSSRGVALGGTIGSPTMTVTPGSIAENNGDVVTGGAVYTALSDKITKSQVVERVDSLPTASATTADLVQLPTGIMYQKEYISGTYSYELVDTTYTSEPAAQGGTDVSLVTTGEKYTWNNKLDDSAMFVDWR